MSTRTLITGITALLLATGAAHAQTEEERQRGLAALKDAIEFYIGPSKTEIKPMRPPRTIEVKYLPVNDRWILPPVAFDHEYPGKIELMRVDEEGLKTTCKRANTKTACSRRWGDQFCEIVIAYDDILNEYRMSYDAVFRHERAHCNGWHHPNEMLGVK